MEALIVIGVIISGIVLFCYSIHKSVTKELKEEADYRAQMDQEVLIENTTKPQFKISFTDVEHNEYETLPAEAFLERSYRRRIQGTLAGKLVIVPSKIVAARRLDNAMEKGYIIDKNGVRFPTCNILQAKVVQHVPG